MNKPNNSKNILEIDNLTVYYETDEGVVKAVNELSLSLEKGTVLGLVGETGSGKTTTALSTLRLVPDPPGVIKSGEIKLDGIDIFSLTEGEMDAMRGGVVSMIFQDPMTSLNPLMKVGDQIAETLIIHEGLDKKTARDQAKEMLRTVGIPVGRIDEYPDQFSGGMKQRVMIAIALSCNPKLLIADEPTTALDVTIQAQVLDEMNDLREEFGMSMILITHDLGIVAGSCDLVAVVYAGHIIEYGTVREVYKNIKHPYTYGLFGSLPRINDEREFLDSIPGTMPDPMDLPSGCPFWPRCKYVKDICKKTYPKAKYFTDTHYVTCHAYDDPSFSLKGDVENE